jgi:hypothetical protein
MSWKSWEQAAERGPGAVAWRVFWFAIPVFIVLVVCSGIVGVVGFGLNPLRQAGRVVNKTIDADNVIYNYEWFKQRHEDIEAIDAKIVDSDAMVATFKEEAGARADWHREDREEYARLSAVTLGLKQQRADLAAEYNARSRMANRAIFKAGDVELPESIPVSTGEAL